MKLISTITLALLAISAISAKPESETATLNRVAIPLVRSYNGGGNKQRLQASNVTCANEKRQTSNATGANEKSQTSNVTGANEKRQTSNVTGANERRQTANVIGANEKRQTSNVTGNKTNF
ncbi:hypothetical protein BDC45DRAFT_535266 [Circinella umbellata]|nr:hypothetical protein BDC45DRAFT_535266 [Circinella umbellata]